MCFTRLACAMVAALAAGSPFLASAASASGSVAPAVAKAAVAKAAAPAAAIKWGPFRWLVSGGSGQLTALGCLTATDCLGWDDTAPGGLFPGGPDVVRWNGSAWSKPTAVTLSGPRNDGTSATSCPTSSFCMTVGQSTGGLPAAAYVYSGGRWTATKPWSPGPRSRDSTARRGPCSRCRPRRTVRAPS